MEREESRKREENRGEIGSCKRGYNREKEVVGRGTKPKDRECPKGDSCRKDEIVPEKGGEMKGEIVEGC